MRQIGIYKLFMKCNQIKHGNKFFIRIYFSSVEQIMKQYWDNMGRTGQGLNQPPNGRG